MMDAPVLVGGGSLDDRLAVATAAARKGDRTALDACLPTLILDLRQELGRLIPIANALEDRGDFTYAEELLRTLLESLPQDYEINALYARAPFRRRAWKEAIERIRVLVAKFPDHPRPLFELANAFRANMQLDESEATFKEAMQRFPDEISFARDYARLLLQQTRFDDALSAAISLQQRFPKHVDGFSIACEALRMLGRFQEAEDTLQAARGQFVNDYHFNYQSAHNATSLRRWQDAFERWEVMLARFLHTNEVKDSIGQTIQLWRLAQAEGDEAALAASPIGEVARRAGIVTDPTSVEFEHNLSDRDLMMRFEGLGDRCEFGLVQRHFGAEPISLLRWSGIETKHLITCLRTSFAGVGEAANTFVNVSPHSREYFAGDNRFFYMHTFIKENAIPQDVVFEKFRNRLLFLRRKLVQDLSDGEKIFVYKPHGTSVTVEEAAEIVGVMQSNFPASRLMLMRVASDSERVGTIESISRNVVWGYLSSFYETTGNRFKADEWRAVCLSALRHFN